MLVLRSRRSPFTVHRSPFTVHRSPYSGFCSLASDFDFCILVAMGESDAHRRLKELTLLWAYRRGYRCCAMEVHAPRSPYRVDVAGVRIDRNPGITTVAVFECKQSRSDLLRDNRRRDELRNRLAQLQERRRKLEALLAVHYPSLRTSDSLFSEWASFDFMALDHQGYRQTIRKIEWVQRQLLQNIKFDLVTHYQLGNLHYLVAPAAMIDPSEVPIGWGFLQVESDGTVIETTVPTRFNQIGSSDWVVRIGQASAAREVRSLIRTNPSPPQETLN